VCSTRPPTARATSPAGSAEGAPTSGIALHRWHKGPGRTNAWYFTAIDFETGKTAYKTLTGGVAGGLVAVRDARQ